MSIWNYWDSKNGGGEGSISMAGYGYGDELEFTVGYPCYFCLEHDTLKKEGCPPWGWLEEERIYNFILKSLYFN